LDKSLWRLLVAVVVVYPMNEGYKEFCHVDSPEIKNQNWALQH